MFLMLLRFAYESRSTFSALNFHDCHDYLKHMSMGQNKRARVTQVLFFDSIPKVPLWYTF